jgi:gas vesicle protein
MDRLEDAMKRWLKFGSGSLLGAAVGTIVALLWAPRSGDELRTQLNERLRQAQLAGAEAKAAKEEELIRRFRAGVSDATALRDEELKVRMETARTVAALGLGLNAPGAIAAQEPELRAAERATLPTTPSAS